MTAAPVLRVAEFQPRISFVFGIDPGPSTAVTLLHLDAPGRLGEHAEVFQCAARSAAALLDWLLGSRYGAMTGRAAAQIEGFAPGRAAGAQHGPMVSAQVEELSAVAARHGVPMTARFMGLVKPWATDDRLKAAGLIELTAGSAHYRASCRHALYRAVHDCGYTDPKSPRAAAKRA